MASSRNRRLFRARTLARASGLALAGFGLVLEHTVWGTGERIAQGVFAGPLVVGAVLIVRSIRWRPHPNPMTRTPETPPRAVD